MAHTRHIRWIWAVLLLFAVASCAREEAGGAPAEMLIRGWRHLRLGEFDLAREQFDLVLRRLDKPVAAGQTGPQRKDLRINALYGLGLLESLERPDSALGDPGKYLHQVIALDPGGEMAAWAELALVRDRHIPARSKDPIDNPALRDGYAAILARYPNTLAAEEAMAYLQSLRVQTLAADDARAAVADIEAHLADHPRSRMRSALYSLHSFACTTLREYPRALASAIAAVEFKETNPDSPNVNNAVDYYRIALMAAYDVGDLQTARKYFRLLLENYPTDLRTFTVNLELQKLEKIEQAARAGRWPATVPADADGGGGS